MRKEELIQAVISEQKNIINNLKTSVERYKTASDIDEDDTVDPDDLGRQTEAKDMQLRFEDLLAKAETELERLKNYSTENSEEIGGEGSIIETEDKYLFTGISVPAFNFNDKEVISISQDAPLYNELAGKKAGDSVKMGDKTLKIISIS